MQVGAHGPGVALGGAADVDGMPRGGATEGFGPTANGVLREGTVGVDIDDDVVGACVMVCGACSATGWVRGAVVGAGGFRPEVCGTTHSATWVCGGASGTDCKKGVGACSESCRDAGLNAFLCFRWGLDLGSAV